MLCCVDNLTEPFEVFVGFSDPIVHGGLRRGRVCILPASTEIYEIIAYEQTDGRCGPGGEDKVDALSEAGPQHYSDV